MGTIFRLAPLVKLLYSTVNKNQIAVEEGHGVQFVCANCGEKFDGNERRKQREEQARTVVIPD